MSNKEALLKIINGDWLRNELAIINLLQLDIDDGKGEEQFNRNLDPVQYGPIEYIEIKSLESCYGPGHERNKSWLMKNPDWETISKDPECQSLIEKTKEIRAAFEVIFNSHGTKKDIYEKLIELSDRTLLELNEMKREFAEENQEGGNGTDKR